MVGIGTFAGKSALITGAASGIGAACASLLAEQGAARLVLIDRDAVNLEALNLPCTCERVVGDVGEEALWAALEPQLAPLDLAVINAGVASGAPIAELDFAEWRRVLSVNLDAVFFTAQEAARRMLAAKKKGSIVNVASILGFGVYQIPPEETEQAVATALEVQRRTGDAWMAALTKFLPQAAKP